jgi:hypothetical protein
MIFNFLHSLIRTREKLEVIRWNHDNTIAHVPLRMRVAEPTEPNPTQRNPSQPNLLKSDDIEHFFYI